MENWAVEKAWLEQWAKHYKTGEKIPDDLVDKIIASKNFFSGYSEFNMIALDKLDMAWHLLSELPEEGVKEILKIGQYRIII